MTERDNKIGNLLLTYKFPNRTDLITDLDSELLLQQEITKTMHSLVQQGIISNYVIADDELISEEIKKHELK